MKERRQHKRYTCPFPLQYCPAGSADFVHSFCGNISMGGLLFVAEDSLELETPIEIVIYKSLDEASAKIELQGKVVRCTERDTDTCLIAVEFLALMQTQIDSLKSFIELYCKPALKGEEIQAKDARGYFIRGLKKFQMGNMPGCIQDFTEALALDPNHQAACLYRGFARDKAGDVSGADEDFQRSVELCKDAE